MKIISLILLLVVVLLTGCKRDRMSGWTIEMATEKCKDHKGISYIAYAIKPDHVVCFDGTMWALKITFQED